MSAPGPGAAHGGSHPRRPARAVAAAVAVAALAAVAARPAAAQSIVVGDGVDPSSGGFVCPGSTAPFLLDAFTMSHSASGAANGLRIQLRPKSAYLLIGRLEVRNAAGTVVGSAMPTADYFSVPVGGPSGVPLTPAAQSFTIWVALRDRVTLPAPRPGYAPSLTAYVESVFSRYPSTSTDQPGTVAIDNASPSDVVWSSVVAGSTTVAIAWNATADVLVLRRKGGPVTDGPTQGQSYTSPGTLGGSDVVATGSRSGYQDDGPLTTGAPYYYEVFSRDTCGNWSGGVPIGPIFPGGSSQGDPGPNSGKVMVGLLNPIGGAVTAPLRVQVRVFSPGGRPIDPASVKLVVDDGVSASRTLGLTRNANRGTALDSGVFEATGGVSLAAGPSYTLRAEANNGLGVVRSAPVGVAVSAFGDGNLLVRDNSSQLCSDCHDLPTHSSETTSNAKGSWFVGCRACHTPHNTRNAALVSESIQPPALVTSVTPAPAKVVFSTRTGYFGGDVTVTPASASYANAPPPAAPDATRTGVCQVCHTRTSRWRSAAGDDGIHLGRCGFCHGHRTGFTARCEDCHAAPPATGAHAAHHGASAPEPPFPGDPRPLGCGSCHPTDPARHGDGMLEVTLDDALVLPGGTRLDGAQLSGPTSSPSCVVACHAPLGAPAQAQPVAWSATGPLPCTSCHARIAPGLKTAAPPAGPSFHAPSFSEARPSSGEPTTCFTCHDAGIHDARHLTGDPGLVAAPTVNAACVLCHTPPSGPAAGSPGQTLHAGADAASSRTPPVLPGWSAATVDAASGDFHGGRRGTCFDPSRGPVPCAPTVTPTGFGGTLKAPFVRGQPALPCATCHAGHASDNAFLFAPEVNGSVIPALAITRGGVGAERLCDACHDGGRHDRCKECHTDTIICPDGQCYMDPAATHVDPAPPGSGCFYCHGHEGIRYWTEPWSGLDMHSGNCAHCHGFSVPPLRTAPPAFTTWNGGTPTVSALDSTSARISWKTDAAATTFVEYGVGQPGWVTGNTADASDHVVALTSLTPGTTYVWRIRSVDPYRNVLRTTVATFRTTPPGVPPFPDLVPVGWTGVDGATAMTQVLQWYPVVSPTGNPLQYRVQLASDPGFTFLVNGGPPDSGWIAGTPGSSGGRPTLTTTVNLWNLPADNCVDAVPSNTYYWRVKVLDSVTLAESDWSATDTFGATDWDPGHCGY